MLPLEFEYVLGDDRTSYEVLLSGLPQGDSNLKRGQVVPTHTKRTPQTFRLKNVIPNTAYLVDVQGEFESAPIQRLYFSPMSDTQLITLPLPYGPSTITIKSVYHERSFFVSVTHYATLLRTYAKEITEYSRQPLNQLEASVTEDLAYRLALPVMAGMSQLIPSDLEFLAVLSHKLLIKNLLHRPGTNGAAREVLAAFCASNPILHKMQNISRLNAPLYRSEETFSGYEAHVWIPNHEVERWRAFTLLLANLPQFYTLSSLNEGEVFFKQGGKLRQHLFDFDSPFANSIFESSGSYDCFLRLFKLNATVETEHFLDFCQASYALDSRILSPGLSSPDVDPLEITKWTGYSLTGRLEQQYAESDKIHHWIYESPLLGEINGRNRFFRLKGVPKSSRSVKVWIDGILQYLNIDFRISLGSSNRSGAVGFKAGSAGVEAFKPPEDSGGAGLLSISTAPSETTPQYLLIETGEPRESVGPAFTSLEVKGEADLQFLLTVGQQTATELGVILAEPPFGSAGGSDDILQEIAVNYVAPALPAEEYPGLNQYGTVNLPLDVSSYYLEFPRPAANSNYQLLVQLAVDPLPADGVSAAWQMNALVRTHSTDGALIEFSDIITQENTKLYWWVIESDDLALERGTIALSQDQNLYRLRFSNGPYTDKVALVYQLWHTSLDAPVANVFISHRKINPGGTYIQFSAALPDDGYKLDWCLFGAEAGSFLEFTEAPPTGAFIETQYDEVWPFWGQAALSPLPDGIRTEFALPHPVEDEKSVYLTINGLLATQGNNRQYTVYKEKNMVRFTSPPDPNQVLWSVYPLRSPFTNKLPSAWDQGFVFSRLDQRGAYATATLKNKAGRLPVGTSLKIKDREYIGVAPAFGQINITGRVEIGSTLTFEELEVTLEAVANAVDSFIFDASGVSVSTNVITIPNHGLENGRIAYLDIGSSLSSLPLGLNQGVGYYIVEATSNTLKLSPILDGPAVDILSSGVGTFQITSPNENFFKVNVSLSDDGKALASCINSHSKLSLFYFAEHLENGQIFVQAKALGGFAKTKTRNSAIDANAVVLEHTLGFPPLGYFMHEGTLHRYQNKTKTSLLGISPRITYSVGDVIQISSYNQTISFSGSGLTKTNISGDTSPSSFESVTVSSGKSLISIDASDVSGDTITFNGGSDILYESLPVKVSGLELPSSLDDKTTYYIRNLVDSVNGKQFNLYTEPTGGVLVLLGSVTSYFNMIVCELDARLSKVFSRNHYFYEKERVKVSALFGTTLPSFLDNNKTYFIRNIDVNSFQISEDVDGDLVEFDELENCNLRFYSVGSFATNISKDFDFEHLAKVVSEDKNIEEYYNVNSFSDYLTISAKKVGPSFNAHVLASSGLDVQNISGGLEPIRDQSFAATKMMYTDQGTVLTLDGLSTRLYKPFGGNEFKFDFRPTLRQEPYYYGEAFPIDSHPFDSMIANEPCNYPKGVFTQGLFSQLTEHAFTHDLNEGDRYFRLTVNTTTLPYQEQPQGLCDGLNREFTLSLSSIAGQNSILLFIDGIFQPSTTYEYKVSSSGASRLILNAPPSSEQKLWAWYIPSDTLRLEPENIDLTTNTIFLDEHFLYQGQVVSLWASSGSLPGGLEVGKAYYVVNTTLSSFQLSETSGGLPVVFSSQGVGVFRLDPSDRFLYEKVKALTGDTNGINQEFSLVGGPVDNRQGLILFLEGLFQLQGQDYLVEVDNSSISFIADKSPAEGQTLWARYSNSSLDSWRQQDLGVTDGIKDTFTIETLLLSDLPTSEDSILLFLNGLCQRQGVDFEVIKDDIGYPTGELHFLGGAPEPNRKVHIAYIKRG